MKKIYTMFAAVAAGALACSAVTPYSLSKVSVMSAPTFQSMEISKEKVAAANAALGLQKAPAAAAASEAPKNLEDIKLNFCYDFMQKGKAIPCSQTLKMKLTQTDAEGIQHYTASNYLPAVTWVDGFEVYDWEILYDPASGVLAIPNEQEVAKLTQNGKVYNFTIWNYTTTGDLWGIVPFYFQYNGDGFEWENPMQFDFGDGKGEVSYTSRGLVAGAIVNEGTDEQSVSPAYILENLNFRIAQGEMSMTAELINQQTGKGEKTDLTGPLFASVSGSTLTVENFGSPALEFVVPFTIDTKAKTLTCKDVLIGKTETGLNLYLSQAKDLFNVYEEEGEYKIVAPYTCEGNTTTVTIGEWNAFYYETSTKEDANAFVPFTDAKMVFYFNLDTIMAGVGNIAVDEADSNAPVEYFNLQGVRVQNPENGLYIRRQGKNVTKVIL